MFQEFKDLFREHYTALSPRELNQLLAACDTGQSDLLDMILKPMAYRPDLGTYLCVTDNVRNEGRSHFGVQNLTGKIGDEWPGQSYFTNAMKIAQHGDTDFNHPSQRIVPSPYVVMTFEYDEDIPWLQEQLAWLRCTKKTSDSAFGRFVADLRNQYADFVGASVVYSGNKSLHFHLVFNTDLLMARAPAGGFTSYREGLKACWNMLKLILATSPHLDIPNSMEPDPMLLFPEWFRRLPLGMRVIEPKRAVAGKAWKHAFHVPMGEVVPQLVMWEDIKVRAGKGASLSAFDPAAFSMTQAAKAHARKTISQSIVTRPNILAADAQSYCEDRMRATFTSYPMFSHFAAEGAETRAYFYNHPTDATPTSLMKWDHHRVMIQGNDPLGLRHKPDIDRLRRPLGEMIEIWTDEHEALNAASIIGRPAGGRIRTSTEQAFAEEATDHKAAIAAISALLTDSIVTIDEDQTRSFISAPEGISKSRSLIAATPKAIRALRKANKPTLVMYAFATYELAEEKAREFNEAHHHKGRYKAQVIESFSRLYERACDQAGIQQITVEMATQAGYLSPMQAIEAMQPPALASIKRHYEALNHELTVGGKHGLPWQRVIFTVHANAHAWVKSSPTRNMLSPAYWAWTMDDQDRHRKMRRDTELGLMIHDEVTARDLVYAVSEATTEWLTRMVGSNPVAWGSNTSVSEKWLAFNAFQKTENCPISFDEACDLVPIQKWEAEVVTGYSGEYGDPRDNDIYAAKAGSKWKVLRKAWPRNAAHRVLVLTTEGVPTNVARFLAEWDVIELDTPLIVKDAVFTYPARGVTSANLGGLVIKEQNDYRSKHGRELTVISNKVAHIVNTKTHASAKGSNSYIGAPVLQTMTMMPPEQFEFYEMLNAYTGRTDMVRTSHIDQFSQTAGRNLGFRRRPGAEHYLLISARLFRCLDGDPKAGCRYVMQEVYTPRGTKTARASIKGTNVFTAPRTTSAERLARLRGKLQAEKAA